MPTENKRNEKCNCHQEEKSSKKKRKSQTQFTVGLPADGMTLIVLNANGLAGNAANSLDLDIEGREQISKGPDSNIIAATAYSEKQTLLLL